VPPFPIHAPPTSPSHTSAPSNLAELGVDAAAAVRPVAEFSAEVSKLLSPYLLFISLSCGPNRRRIVTGSHRPPHRVLRRLQAVSIQEKHLGEFAVIPYPSQYCSHRDPCPKSHFRWNSGEVLAASHGATSSHLCPGTFRSTATRGHGPPSPVHSTAQPVHQPEPVPPRHVSWRPDQPRHICEESVNQAHFAKEPLTFQE
jgi:hypothetical protein